MTTSSLASHGYPWVLLRCVKLFVFGLLLSSVSVFHYRPAEALWLASLSRFSAASVSFGRLIQVTCKASGNHAALKHFVDNRSGHLVDELRAHLRITAQELQGFLLLW
jgi:hypothetical protein